jgi:hypothetical protein
MSDTFVLTLTGDAAWYIRGVVRPGMDIDWPTEAPQAKIDAVMRGLRQKINTTILRQIDEDLTTVGIDCTEAEAWLIDASVSFDGLGGVGTDLLIQLFRGFWYLDIGQHIAGTSEIAADPHATWSSEMLKGIKKDDELPLTPDSPGQPPGWVEPPEEEPPIAIS